MILIWILDFGKEWVRHDFDNCEISYDVIRDGDIGQCHDHL